MLDICPQIVSHFVQFGKKESRNIKLRSDADNCTIELVNMGVSSREVAVRLHIGADLEQRVHDRWAVEGLQTRGW